MKNNIVKNLDKPRILMIAPVFYPYPPVWPEGMVNAKLALAIKKAGWHIDIIVAGYPHASNRYPSEETVWKALAPDVHIIRREDHRSFARKLLDTMRVFIMTGQLLRQLAWGLSVLDVTKKLYIQHHHDVIISRAVPDYAHFAALLVHRNLGIPWIANWNDPTPNHKFPPPYGEGPFSPLALNTQKWYTSICKHCSWHTFPTERLREYICSYLPGQIYSKSSVIPHVAMEGFSAAPGTHEGFSLCYAGSVQPPRNVNVFFEGIKKFVVLSDIQESFTVRFLVDKQAMVADRAAAMGLENIVKIEDTVPYSEMPEALSRSNILVIIEAPLEEGIFMPSKIVDYAQIGLPILALAPVIGTVNDIFSKHGGGIAADCKSPDAVAKALYELYSHWKAKTLNCVYGSSPLIKLFGEEKVLRLYMDLFSKLSIFPAS
jgi:hypothetical protein